MHKSVNYFKDNVKQMACLVSQQRFNGSLAVRSFAAPNVPRCYMVLIIKAVYKEEEIFFSYSV